MTKHRRRLYADESGTHHYPTTDWDNPAKRYFALTGVAFDSHYYQTIIQPKVRAIKLLIASDPDYLPILHRADILNYEGDYSKLKDNPELQREFDKQILELLSDPGLVICTVVMDKTAHFQKYGQAARHPYHLASIVLLESYIHFLHANGLKGDVMAEARGGKYDRELEAEYRQFHQNGTQFMSTEYIQTALTSKDIKVRWKSEAIAGLEIADLLTLATKIDVLHTFGHIKSLDSNFQTRIIERIQGNYYQENGTSKGFGKKFL